MATTNYVQISKDESQKSEDADQKRFTSGAVEIELTGLETTQGKWDETMLTIFDLMRQLAKIYYQDCVDEVIALVDGVQKGSRDMSELEPFLIAFVAVDLM